MQYKDNCPLADSFSSSDHVKLLDRRKPSVSTE